MNLKNVQELRDYIAIQPDEDCDMDHWRCGTAACIGGHLETLLFRKRLIWPREDDLLEHVDEICAFLGLPDVDEDNAGYSELFYSWPDPEDLPESHRLPGTSYHLFDAKRWMLARLDDILATGVVRHWRLVFEERYLAVVPI